MCSYIFIIIKKDGSLIAIAIYIKTYTISYIQIDFGSGHALSSVINGNYMDMHD